MSITSKKVVAAVVGFGLALSIFAAVGVSTASAQAMTLSQLVDLFISLGIIAPEKAAAAKAAVSSSPSSMVFSKDLTVGSTGDEVVALQQKLGVSPASGYFGSITKAAVQQYQASKGVPATGFVGPLTRAQLNAGASVGTPSTPGTTPVVNSGVEGTLAVETASSPSNGRTVREGESMTALLGIEAEAKLSDIAIQRVKLDLGTDTEIYTKVFKTLYLTDASGRVLAQADLNSNTVVKEGSRYYLTFSGFSYVVPRDSTKVLTVKGDLYSSIDLDEVDFDSPTIQLANNGVRGVDGAGIDQYSPATGSDVARTVTLGTTLIDDAALKLSLNSANVKASDVVAANGSDEDEVDGVSVLMFDLKAEKDNVLVTDIVVDVDKTGAGAATATTAYLFVGSEEIGSATVNTASGLATFDDIDYSISKDSTKTFTVKVDIRDANGTASVIEASVSDITSENSVGDSITETGSAQGENFTVRNAGVMVELVGTPSITKSSTPEQNSISTSTVSATFNVKLTAVGNDVFFGTQSASSTFGIAVYKGGVVDHTTNLGTSTSWSIPSSGVVSSGLNATTAFKLQENNSVTIPVTFIFQGRTAAGALVAVNSYAAGLENVVWSTSEVGAPVFSSFMAGKTEWRTASVQLP